MVCNVFKKLVNNSFVDKLEKYGLFSISSIILGLLTNYRPCASDRIARAFNRSGASRAAHLIHPRLLTEFGMQVFLTNLSFMEFWVNYWPYLVFSQE